MRDIAQIFFYLFCALLRNQFGEVEQENQMGADSIPGVGIPESNQAM